MNEMDGNIINALQYTVNVSTALDQPLATYTYRASGNSHQNGFQLLSSYMHVCETRSGLQK